MPAARRMSDHFPALRMRKGTHMKPTNRFTTRLVFAAVCLTALTAMPVAHAQTNTRDVEVITNGPQTNPGDAQGARSGPQNVRDSQRYDSQVQSNPNFRADRERKECGPIDDARMHAACIAGLGK
jgi:hypothetical protein